MVMCEDIKFELNSRGFIIANLWIKHYFCHRKQGEKIGCYRYIGTPVFGVQGGRDATLFFFYVSAAPECDKAHIRPPRNYRLS